MTTVLFQINACHELKQQKGDSEAIAITCVVSFLVHATYLHFFFFFFNSY